MFGNIFICIYKFEYCKEYMKYKDPKDFYTNLKKIIFNKTLDI